jgi:hypothetical protein
MSNMPIETKEKSTQLHFGTGDIEVAPGLLKQDEIIGAVCFFQRQSQNQIGERGDYKPHMVVDAEHTPVRMTFDKTESIDVVIWALQETKRMMLDGRVNASVSTESPSEAEAE